MPRLLTARPVRSSTRRGLRRLDAGAARHERQRNPVDEAGANDRLRVGLHLRIRLAGQAMAPGLAEQIRLALPCELCSEEFVHVPQTREWGGIFPVSVFRPSVRVSAPDGRRWELYAYRRRTRSVHARRLARAVDAVAASLRALRADVWTVEAVAWLPRPTSYTWTTTTEFRGHVLAQVEGSLARGHIPAQLAHATFAGESRYVRRSARYRRPSG